MTSEEAAWLAGFIDGEGTISSYMAGKNRAYKTWVISVPNTHRGSLDRCQEITGVGSVVMKKEAHGNRRTQYQWRVNPKQDVASILDQILPYLIVKREQAEACLADIRQ